MEKSLTPVNAGNSTVYQSNNKKKHRNTGLSRPSPKSDRGSNAPSSVSGQSLWTSSQIYDFGSELGLLLKNFGTFRSFGLFSDVDILTKLYTYIQSQLMMIFVRKNSKRIANFRSKSYFGNSNSIISEWTIGNFGPKSEKNPTELEIKKKNRIRAQFSSNANRLLWFLK